MVKLLTTQKFDSIYDKSGYCYQYPYLSDLIKDLQEVLDRYGDGLVQTDNEYTNELRSIVLEKYNAEVGLASSSGVPKNTRLYTLCVGNPEGE